MKVLITGASGFIGRNLIEFLSDKFDLILPTHSELDFLDEQAVERYLKRNLPDVLVHAAAVGISRKDNTADALAANLRMFANAARCHKLYGKMIFIGSGAEYDKRRDLVHVKEGDFDSSVPNDPYGFAKYLSSRLIVGFPNIINLRAFAVFGKYEDYETRFISNTICRSLFKLPVVINQDVKFDYFDVSDLARVVGHFIENSAREQFYNVGAGREISLSEIVRKIEALYGQRLKVTINTPGWNKEYSCDNSRLLAELPGFQFKDFDEALQDLYNWYAASQSTIDRARLSFDR